MEIYEKNYNKWLEKLDHDDKMKTRLLCMKKQEKMDSFYKYIDFGTGGVRGELGIGTNKLNIYTIRKITEGLSLYLEEKNNKEKSIVIAYDTRFMSKEFCLEVAKNFITHGFKVYIFDDVRPTPLLSFAVRYLKADIGIVITASHNPSNYNGYKIYNETGAQIVTHEANSIKKYIDLVEDEFRIKVISDDFLFNNPNFSIIGNRVENAYLEKVNSLIIDKELIKNVGNNLLIVFSSLHGTAKKLVPQALKDAGFKNVIIVKEQSNFDSNFSTVESPNPEEYSAFNLAIQYGEKVGADILLATDPDSDRLGVMVKDFNNEYRQVNGNQLGALILTYLLSNYKEKLKNYNENFLLKTIVTSNLGEMIANKYGVKTINTLTGFKFIGEQINMIPKDSKFILGYEESYGFLIGDFVRDKDAIQAAVIISEIATYYKNKDMNLFDALHTIYEEYGYYKEELFSISLKGLEGEQKIQEIMLNYRKNPIKSTKIGMVKFVEDFQKKIKINLLEKTSFPISLPKSNVLKFILEDGSWFCLRPSGTEPKIKIYLSVLGETELDCERKMELLKDEILAELY
ncbi:phospho-sugar mutase [Carnobacterium gallinarum]|uniref:phospho-sugar mutase n=1 Tax=Carnobacterium gallinarum TaxID=2749 RepID=UPI0005584AE6|nr:phospho-sugar mutase [Carnobacterium gallinarum]